MLFPNLELESTVQVNDRTRLDASKTYAPKGSTITKVEIEPDTGAGYIQVSGTGLTYKDWLTDWQYSSAGTKTVSLRLNGGDVTEVIVTKQITVVTAAADALFSSDQDLVAEENDVLKYVRKGRNTFLDIHREAQRQILELLDRMGYRTTSGAKIQKTDVKDLSEVRAMSKYLVLYMIFNSNSNQVGDILSQKAETYYGKYLKMQDRKLVGLDLNGDGVADQGEGVDLTARMVRW